MNEWTGHGEPTLADLHGEFPGWECWRDISGLYYARRPGQPRGQKPNVWGEDPRDLRDEIIRVAWREEAEAGQ